MRPSNLILALVILGLTVSTLAVPAKSLEKKSLPNGTSAAKDTKSTSIEPKVEIDSESTDSKKDVERAKKSAEVSRVCVEVHSPKNTQSGENCGCPFQHSEAQVIVPQEHAPSVPPCAEHPAAGGEPVYVIPGGDVPDGGAQSSAVTIIPGGGYPSLYPSSPVTVIPGAGFPGYLPLYPSYYPQPIQPSAPLIVVSNPPQMQPQPQPTVFIPGHHGSHHHPPSQVECNCHHVRAGSPTAKSGGEAGLMSGMMVEGDSASHLGPSPSASPMEFGQGRSAEGNLSQMDQAARHHKYPVIVSYGGGGGYPSSSSVMTYSTRPNTYSGMPYIYGAGIRSSEAEPLSPLWQNPLNRNAGFQSLPSGATSQPMFLAQGSMGSPMNGAQAYRLAGPGAAVYQQTYHSSVQSMDGGLRPYNSMTNCMPYNGQPMGPMLRFGGQQPLKYTAGPTNLPMPLHRHYRQPENSEDVAAQAESATGKTLAVEHEENPADGSPKHVRETEKFPDGEQQQQQPFVLSGPVEQVKAKRETQEKKSESIRKS